MRLNFPVLGTVLFFLLGTATIAPAQEPIRAHNRSLYSGAQKIVLRAAEQMPEEHYGFRPVESVRTFGQIVGHVADAQYTFCSAVLGEKNPALQIEKTKSSKAELIPALRAAFAYCERAYDALTDVTAAGSIRFGGRDTPRLGVLTVNEVHTIEHYGNMVTYLRMKSLVPPTSDPEFMKELSR